MVKQTHPADLEAAFWPIREFTERFQRRASIIRKRLEDGGHLPGPADQIRRLAVFRILATGSLLCVAALLACQLWVLAGAVALACAPSVIGWAMMAGYLHGYRVGAVRVTADALDMAEHPGADLSLYASLPVAPDGHGYLYALRFTTGVVKVGQTSDLGRRLNEHRRDAFAFNVRMVDVWVSTAHLGYMENEAALIGFVRTLARRARREYFHDADFGMVVEYAKSLVGAVLAQA